jgi:hypothetical protein
MLARHCLNRETWALKMKGAIPSTYLVAMIQAGKWPKILQPEWSFETMLADATFVLVLQLEPEEEEVSLLALYEGANIELTRMAGCFSHFVC